MPSTEPGNGPSRGSARPHRTLWEEGRHPGPLVARAAVVVLLLATLVSLAFGNRLGAVYDVVFVLVCIAAPLWVRPRDFFMVGVMPPLLLAGTVTVLAWFDRGAVARTDDPLAQAIVSGLAHHATALTLGYALTLGLLALRQVALRRRGALRRPRARTPRPSLGVPTAEAPPSGDSAGLGHPRDASRAGVSTS